MEITLGAWQYVLSEWQRIGNLFPGIFYILQTYLLNTYYILNTVLDSKDTALNTVDKISTLTDLLF